MLAAKPRRFDVPTEGAANPLHAIGNDRFAVAGATQHNSPFAFRASHRFGHRTNKKRIIDGCIRVGAEIEHGVAEGLQEAFYFFLVVKPCMIRADGDFHSGCSASHEPWLRASVIGWLKMSWPEEPSVSYCCHQAHAL